MYWEASAAKFFKTNSFLLTLLVGTAELTRLLVTGFGAAQGDKCSKFDFNGKKTHNISVDKKYQFKYFESPHFFVTNQLL